MTSATQQEPTSARTFITRLHCQPSADCVLYLEFIQTPCQFGRCAPPTCFRFAPVHAALRRGELVSSGERHDRRVMSCEPLTRSDAALRSARSGTAAEPAGFLCGWRGRRRRRGLFGLGGLLDLGELLERHLQRLRRVLVEAIAFR